jgi:hypothetical protein
VASRAGIGVKVKDNVLAVMGGVRDLTDLIPAAFRERFQLAEPMQYGMVCRDMPDKIARLEALGAGPFVHGTVGLPGWKEHGVARKVRNEVALGYCEKQQVELLGPGSNTDLYAEKIPADGGFALHHVGIAQLGLAASRRAFAEAGIEAVVELGMNFGPLYSIDVAYFDTRDELGFYVELLEFRSFGRHLPLGEGLISAVGGLQRRLGRRRTVRNPR